MDVYENVEVNLEDLTTTKESKKEYMKYKRYLNKIKRKIEKRNKLKELIRKFSKKYNNR